MVHLVFRSCRVELLRARPRQAAWVRAQHGQLSEQVRKLKGSRVTRATLFSKGSPPHSGVYSPRPSMLSSLSQHKHLSISGSWTLCHSFPISSGKTPIHSSKPTIILPLPGSLFFFFTCLPSSPLATGVSAVFRDLATSTSREDGQCGEGGARRPHSASPTPKAV